MKPLRQLQGGAIAVALAAIAGTSVADLKSVHESKPPPHQVVASDVTGLAPECRPFLAIPADSTSELLLWDQRLSLAACRLSTKVLPVSNPEDFRAMVASLERAAQPTIATYRDAIAHGPTQIRIVAAYELGMTYVNMMVRARNAIRVTDPGLAYGGATYGGPTYLERLQTLHRGLEPLLAGYRDTALAAFRDAGRLAGEDPGAASANPVVAGAVTNARVEAELLADHER